MILVTNVKFNLDTDFECFFDAVKRHPTFASIRIISASLYRKSIDARHKNDIHFCCSVLIEVEGSEAAALKKLKNAAIYSESVYSYKSADKSCENSPVVVGFGPAGIFAAYTLAKAGLKPIVLERGRDVDTRTAEVEAFWNGRELNPETNVQFGEGGAGTFSDGKLTTGIKDHRCREILKLFHAFGAKKEILTDAKPHIGTDVLSKVVKNLRNEIIALGGEVRFANRLEKIYISDGKLEAIDVYAKKSVKRIECNRLILATGHSARDTFKMLYESGVEMVRKPFAVGVRIEHFQEQIDKAMYGDMAGHPALPPAEYKLAVHLPSGRGVYTFCMCPGGYVVNASSEAGHTAINGMSKSGRDNYAANSAVLTEILPEDLDGDNVLAGIEFQREIEKKAFELTGRRGVPVQSVGNYLFKDGTETVVVPTVKPFPVYSDISKVFPDFVNNALKAGIPELGKKLKGFDHPQASLIAPETRSSSPVRILRNEELCSVNVEGLYPCGEGAGYAGGIMSAAVDGMKCAEAIIETLNQP